MTSNGAPSTEAAGTVGQGSLIGHRFGGYRVESRLASGGLGEVFLLRHTTLVEKQRVLKTILPEYADRADIRERFHFEARAVAQLGDHPQIVGIDDYGMLEDGRLWIMMPFLHGQPLDEYLRDKGGLLPAYRVLELLIDVALALDHAHRHGIIHRDIKPSNVFVLQRDGRPSCKLLDFGIARQRNSGGVSQTQSALGTPSYMAAEQYEHAADADVPADVYALACMAWELESSTPPWSEADMAVLYHQKLNVPPPPPRAGSMSPEREAFLRQCVLPDPARRPQSVRHFIAGYAATIAAPSRLVPGGLQLVAQRGPSLLERSDEQTTVRKPSDATSVGATQGVGVRPAPLQTTTLGSASAALSAASTRAPRPRSVLGLGALVAVLAAGGVYAVASQVRRGSVDLDTSRAAKYGAQSSAPTQTLSPPVSSSATSPAPSSAATPAPSSAATPVPSSAATPNTGHAAASPGTGDARSLPPHGTVNARHSSSEADFADPSPHSAAPVAPRGPDNAPTSTRLPPSSTAELPPPAFAPQPGRATADTSTMNAKHPSPAVATPGVRKISPSAVLPPSAPSREPAPRPEKREAQTQAATFDPNAAAGE